MSDLRQSVTIDYVIGFINHLVEIDPDAITELVNFRVGCNMDMADHESVQVGHNNEGFTVGFAGLLNGIFGIHEDGWGPISFVSDENGKIIRVSRTVSMMDDN